MGLLRCEADGFHLLGGTGTDSRVGVAYMVCEHVLEGVQACRGGGHVHGTVPHGMARRISRVDTATQRGGHAPVLVRKSNDVCGQHYKRCIEVYVASVQRPSVFVVVVGGGGWPTDAEHFIDALQEGRTRAHAKVHDADWCWRSLQPVHLMRQKAHWTLSL